MQKTENKNHQTFKHILMEEQEVFSSYQMLKILLSLISINNMLKLQVLIYIFLNGLFMSKINPILRKVEKASISFSGVLKLLIYKYWI